MANIASIEIIERGRHEWLKLPPREQFRVLELEFVERIAGARIYFRPDTDAEEVSDRLEPVLRGLIGGKPQYTTTYHSASVVEVFSRAIQNPEVFQRLDIGEDVAEHDRNLGRYFVATSAYKATLNGKS